MELKNWSFIKKLYPLAFVNDEEKQQGFLTIC